MASGKTVTIHSTSRDRYGRIVGEVILPSGENLNHELVRAGLAWWYRKYAPGDQGLARFEREAKKARLGLWSEPNLVPPWDWRRRVRSGGSITATESGGAYHGNVKSKFFHKQGCRYYNCKSCTAVFQTRDEAIAAGFRFYRECKP